MFKMSFSTISKIRFAVLNRVDSLALFIYNSMCAGSVARLYCMLSEPCSSVLSLNVSRPPFLFILWIFLWFCHLMAYHVLSLACSTVLILDCVLVLSKVSYTEFLNLLLSPVCYTFSSTLAHSH